MKLELQVKDLSIIQEIWDLWAVWNGAKAEIPRDRFPRLCELSETIIKQWTLEDELQLTRDNKGKQKW